MKFNWWNLIIGLFIANFVSAMLAALDSPGIAHVVCWFVISLAFPWIEVTGLKQKCSICGKDNHGSANCPTWFGKNGRDNDGQH